MINCNFSLICEYTLNLSLFNDFSSPIKVTKSYTHQPEHVGEPHIMATLLTEISKLIIWEMYSNFCGICIHTVPSTLVTLIFKCML